MKALAIGFSFGVLLAGVFVFGCGADDTHSAAASGGGDDGGACVIAPRPAASLPKVAASGDAARAVLKAIDAILAAHSPPIPPGVHTYASAELDVSDLWAPSAADGYGASFDLEIDGAPAVHVDVARPSPLAKDLQDALVSAKMKACDDPAHGEFLRARAFEAELAPPHLELDDGSRYELPPEPNIVIAASAGQPVVDALRGAASPDCDAARRLFVVCTKLSAPPACSVTRDLLDDVDGSELIHTCTPSETATPKALDAASSAAVWSAILGAAKTVGYQPLQGAVDDATVINAGYFQVDADELGFTLTLDDATPPPPPHAP